MVSWPISLSASATIASPMPSISWIRLRREESSWMARSRAAPSRTELNRRAFATAIAIWFANVVHQLQLVRRPAIGRPVVQHQQAECLAMLDERDVADRPEPGPGVELADDGGGLGAVQDDALPLGHGPQADRLVVAGDGGDRLDQLVGEVVVGHQPQGMAIGRDEPQAGGIGGEQRPRRLDDVVEDLVRLQARADLRHDAAHRDACEPRAPVEGAPRPPRRARCPRPRTAA